MIMQDWKHIDTREDDAEQWLRYVIHRGVDAACFLILLALTMTLPWWLEALISGVR